MIRGGEKVKPMKLVVDGGNGMAGPMVGPLLRHLKMKTHRALLQARRQLPRPRAEPAARGEPKADLRDRHRRGRRPRHRLGRRRRPLLLHRQRGDVRRRGLPHRAAGRVAARQEGRRAHPLRRPRQPGGARHGRGRRRDLGAEPRRPRLLQGEDARDRRASSAARSRATTTSRTSSAPTPGRSRRCWSSSSSPRRRSTMVDLMKDFRSKYFISGEINSEVDDQAGKMAEIEKKHSGRRDHPPRRRLGRLRRLALQRAPVEHRAPAAPEPRVARLARAHGGEARRGPGADPRVSEASRRRTPSGRRSTRPASRCCGSRPRSRSGASTAT